ncbi:related to neomycin resistance protein NEO1 [Oceanobacillus picturae]|uniref:Related to neomycin resistance protein NEO1 n=1 Tax=Oceanobacillus picturae TaxID=171693 RepID=A0A0U9H5I2_9BACI|nr:hypothetical protein [Oceanobacillus picturae]GAQ17743.1 related to neomycin resistance protein NEO1 [Oceanobacillus picturae]
MRKINLNEIDDNIISNKKQANEIIQKEFGSKRRKKSRTRSEGEKIALDEISLNRWEKAVESGKIKRTGKRRLYYDYH